jgi:ABC-type branched-subunit amino acid transport system substrate-binding protein
MGVHRLIDYGVDMIIGGYCGAAMQAIFNILRDSNTLFITPFSWNSEITSQNYNKIFRMNPRFETIGLSIEDFMKKNGLNKLAIIQYKYNSLSDQLSNFIVIDIVIEDKQQDYFNNEINQIISSSFDTIFYNVSSTQGSQIMSNLRRRGQFTGRATRPYLLFNGVYAGQIEWESLIGMEDKVYAVGGNIPDYNHSEYNNFKNAYRRLYGELPKNEITFFAYDAAMIYLRAVDKAKTTDKNIIARVIKDSVWSGVTGIISFAPNGDRRIRYALSRLSDGKYIDRICADDECECNTNSCCDKSNGCK